MNPQAVVNDMQYENLLNMKQKEANVVEASCARVSSQMATRQGYAMMTFTVVTVLFVSDSTDEWATVLTLSIATIVILHIPFWNERSRLERPSIQRGSA